MYSLSLVISPIREVAYPPIYVAIANIGSCQRSCNFLGRFMCLISSQNDDAGRVD